MWKSPRALNVAQSDDGRMKRISKITSEMAQLQEQKNEALRMKLRGEVDLPTYRAVTRELDAAHDQLAREHENLASEAAMPQLPDPSLAWEDLSAVDRRALTEMLVDKIIIEAAPEQDRQGRQAPLHIRAIPYQDPELEAARLNAVHEARVKISPGSEQQVGHRGRTPLNHATRTFPWSLTTRTIAVMAKPLRCRLRLHDSTRGSIAKTRDESRFGVLLDELTSVAPHA